MALERLGHTKLFLQHKEQEIEQMTQEIVKACTKLASEKVGALIVLQQNITLKEYEDTGVSLQAKVSAVLIESIFHTTSPMHDGAIIIGNQRIRSASCILPHSYKNIQGLGTRHKAALGLSETTDAAVIVVSEEKGTISFAKGGTLEKNIQPNTLHRLIIQTLQPPRPKKNTRIKS
jgi:diadenylate cyclase